MRARFGLTPLLAVAAEAAMIREQKVIGRLAGFPRNAGGVVHSIPRSST
jgi:hypothetical protein